MELENDFKKLMQDVNSKVQNNEVLHLDELKHLYNLLAFKIDERVWIDSGYYEDSYEDNWESSDC